MNFLQLNQETTSGEVFAKTLVSKLEKFLPLSKLPGPDVKVLELLPHARTGVFREDLEACFLFRVEMSEHLLH